MENNDFAVGYAMGDNTANRNNCGYGNNGMWGMEWIFALLILPMIWGGNGPFGNNNRGECVTESDLCNANSFNELKSSVGRGFDQQTQFAFQNQRDLCTSTATLSSQIAAAAAAQEKCCCETKSDILENRYIGAQNTSAIIQSQERGTQKILDYLCNQENMRLRDENMKNYIQSQFCGVVRYPTQTTYGAGYNPFFGYGGGYDCNRCCNGNI